jgi:hypothetical protein
LLLQFTAKDFSLRFFFFLPMIKGWIRLRITLAVIGLVGGLVGIIVASLAPSIAEGIIKGKVYDSVRINPDTMSDSSLALFLNATTYADYHLYNITNLYQALTLPDTTLLFSDVTIRTSQYVQKYDVTWNAYSDRVSYKELVTFDVHPDDQWLLSRPIVSINPFYIGAAAQVMRQVTQQTTGSPTPSADFTLLNEQLMTAGLLGAQVVPGIALIYTSTSQPFLRQLRLFATPLYLQTAQNTSSMTNDWPADRDAWALGTPRLSLRNNNASTFAGFELPRTLTCSNPQAAASRLFDSANAYGLVSASSIALWMTVAASLSSSTSNLSQQLATANLLTLDDVTLIVGWLAQLSQSSAYEATTCAALDNALAQSISESSTLQTIVAENQAAFLPPLTTWPQVGALQWATGWVVALLAAAPHTWLVGDGIGMSATQVPILASTTGGLLEFQAGINSYIVTNPSAFFCTSTCPAGSSQVLLWQTNPRLLLGTNQLPAPPGTAWPVAIPTTAATRLLTTLASNTNVYGNLCKLLGSITNAYATRLSQSLASGQNLTSSISQATLTAQATFVSLSPTNAALLSAAGIDTSNW